MGLASIGQSRRRPALLGLPPKTSVAYGLRQMAPLKASYIGAKSNHKTYGSFPPQISYFALPIWVLPVFHF
jgi:hypothetical protein